MDIDADTPSWYRPTPEEMRGHSALSGGQFRRALTTGLNTLKVGAVATTFLAAGMNHGANTLDTHEDPVPTMPLYSHAHTYDRNIEMSPDRQSGF